MKTLFFVELYRDVPCPEVAEEDTNKRVATEHIFRGWGGGFPLNQESKNDPLKINMTMEKQPFEDVLSH